MEGGRMKRKLLKIVLGFAWIGALLAVVTCNSVNRESSPVQLIVTNTQFLQIIDVNGGNGCDQDVGTLELRSLLLQDQTNTTLATDNRLNDIIIDRYQVTYARTDGGSAVPHSFVRTISTTVTSGGTASFFSKFIVFEPDAVRQAPFAALLPANGGRDPQTGKSFVTMDIVVQVFGQTLAGERVSGTTKFPLTFCFDCGGCS
jgi:hypothetical protein